MRRFSAEFQALAPRGLAASAVVEGPLPPSQQPQESEQEKKVNAAESVGSTSLLKANITRKLSIIINLPFYSDSNYKTQEFLNTIEAES